jgi:hypothetical protein
VWSSGSQSSEESVKSKNIDEFARIFLQDKAEEARISNICKLTKHCGKRPRRKSEF